MSWCPFDREVLASNDVSGYRYFSCERCGGYWIPGGAINQALSARGILELRAIPAIGRSNLSCPDCQAHLEIIPVHGCILDSCGRCHGIWLDAGEAQRVSKLLPVDSAILDADQNRVGQAANGPFAALSVVDAVVYLLSLVGK
jgi:Zn-finger nucleic acid-binding protein